MDRCVTDLLALRDVVDRVDRDQILNQPLVVGHAPALSRASPGIR